MAELEIKIIKDKALVRISSRMFDKRNGGLIQFLSPFCKDIQWSIEDLKENVSVPQKHNQKGCGKKLPVKERQVTDSLVCNEFQLCKKCKVENDSETGGKHE